MKFFNYALLLIMLAGCNTKNNLDCELIELDKSVLMNADELNVDTITINHDFPASYAYHYYNDSIIIIMNNREENRHYIELYNNKRDTVFCQLLRNGRGPGEALLLDPNARIIENYLYTGDIALFNFYAINIDSLLSNPEHKYRVYKKNESASVSTTLLFNGKLISENTNRFSNQELGIHQEEPTFLIYDSTYQKAINNVDYKYNTYAVTNCSSILANSKRKIICQASLWSSNIEFFNKDFLAYKRITGPINIPVKYKITNNKVSFNGRLPYAYLGSCFNNAYIYLYYVGKFYDEIKDSEVEQEYYIFKLDWEGNLIKVYKTRYYITAISCDHTKVCDKDVIYASVENAQGQPVLLQLSEK